MNIVQDAILDCARNIHAGLIAGLKCSSVNVGRPPARCYREGDSVSVCIAPGASCDFHGDCAGSIRFAVLQAATGIVRVRKASNLPAASAALVADILSRIQRPRDKSLLVTAQMDMEGTYVGIVSTAWNLSFRILCIPWFEDGNWTVRVDLLYAWV